ncbi:hypothetical protein FPHYL_5149 [Fusarium phyllophilum]|uniref:Uncharacterized protein n=1 Tax=Fusarium phyllophilum TaxID=47803 RepID=A0A8H5NFL5_9HYPO|nr:hypothetical protein FPHYL_5149 [Fusarium phyllophilum]
MLVRSHYPKKKSLRKGFKNLLRGPLEKRVKPSRAELEKVEKEKKTKTKTKGKEKGKSRPQASAAKPSTSSEVERLTTLVSETDLLLEASNPLLESIIENPVVQNQVFIATNESNITAVDPQGQSQTPTLYPWEHNTLVTSAPYSEPYSLPISEQDIQCTAPSFTSSITQASDLELDLNDSFPLPESTQTTSLLERPVASSICYLSWTQFGAPSIQSPLVPDYTQDFGDLSALAWPPDMGHDLQQELPPPAPSIFSSSSSAGQNPSLVKATYDGGYSTRQAVTFNVSLDHSFIAQSSVEMLQHSFPIQVLSYPPGAGRKTKCPSGALIDIEQILYAWIEFESHHVPFPPTRPYFVVYNDFIGDDGIHITLGRDWVKKIEQACPQIG